jgi:ATP-binding cassette, subfamily B, bacterial PglK
LKPFKKLNVLLNSIRDTVIYRCLEILPRADKRKLVAISIIQVSLAGLDLLGVATIGVLGALSVNGVASMQQGSRIQNFLTVLRIENFTFQTQAMILGLSAAIILIVRTALSVYFSRKTLFFLSRRNAMITSELASKLLSKSMLEIQEKTTQTTLYSLTYGVNAITLGIVSTLINVLADSALLVVMFLGLFVVDPVIAISTLVLFGLIGFMLFKLLHRKALAYGRRDAQLTIEIGEKLLEVLNSYRESVVRNRRRYYAEEISKLKLSASDVQAELYFMPSVSKYVIETAIVLGALGVSALQFIMNDAVHAVSTLAVFLAAGTRIAPAVMRVQQGAIQIKGSTGTATPTLELIESLKQSAELQKVSNENDTQHLGFSPGISMTKISVRYPGKSEYALREFTLEVNPGEMVAIVGPSGAGKTTLVDTLLGILKPESGQTLISGGAPSDVISRWPGAIGYVPQNVEIINDSIQRNISMGFPTDQVSESVIWDCLRIAHLAKMVEELPDGIHTHVGERGTKLSGGQRQRLGIARALFTKPKLIVLDEATSSLDAETELLISNSIEELRGKVTIVTIAHRLSTVRSADRVVYLERGKNVYSGKFDDVRVNVPNFNTQANLLGL